MDISDTPPISTADARDRLAEIVNRAAYGKERVVLSRRGKPLAALVPIEDIQALEALEDQRDAQELQARMAEWKQEAEARLAAGEADGAVSLEEVVRRHGIALG